MASPDGRRNAPAKRAAVEWYAESRSVDVYVDVPISRPDWRGWPPDAGRYWFDAVAVEVEAGRLIEWDEKEIEAFDAACKPGLTLLLGWRYVDRPALGKLEMGTLMFKRSFPAHGPITRVALVNELGSNVDSIFDRYGVELVELPHDFSA
jgi:hypothetical protein